MNSLIKTSPLSQPDIIEYVRTQRNSLIKSLLQDDALKAYLLEQYKITELSRVKLEFIKRALQNLLIEPVDLAHYSKFILDMKGAQDLHVPDQHRALFHQNVHATIRNYLIG